MARRSLGLPLPSQPEGRPRPSATAADKRYDRQLPLRKWTPGLVVRARAALAPQHGRPQGAFGHVADQVTCSWTSASSAGAGEKRRSNCSSPVVVSNSAWACYYYRQWPQLFDSMLRMTRSGFGLSLPQGVYASYINTQAQIAWARQGAQGGQAEALMRQFYEYVREPTGGRYDSAKAAQLEVNWWAVHRNRNQYPDHSALAQALADTYAEVYQMPAERLLPAGEARAAAMDLSDQWIREGKDPNSPLLEQIATLLVQSYRSLSEAIGPGR
jgi:hypothetical protein